MFAAVVVSQNPMASVAVLRIRIGVLLYVYMFYVLAVGGFPPSLVDGRRTYYRHSGGVPKTTTAAARETRKPRWYSRSSYPGPLTIYRIRRIMCIRTHIAAVSSRTNLVSLTPRRFLPRLLCTYMYIYIYIYTRREGNIVVRARTAGRWCTVYAGRAKFPAFRRYTRTSIFIYI